MTMQNPLDILNRFSASPQDLFNARQSGQQATSSQLAIDQQRALNPLLLEQQQLANQQSQIQTRGLETQENINNTVNRLQELERQIGFGATPQQLEQTIQGFIAESQARGGNPADSMQALQALQQGGVEGLSGLLGQAKKVFESQGLLKPEGLSEERKLDILGQQKMELEKLKGEQDLALAKLKAEFDAQPDKTKQSDSLRSEVVDINKRLKFDDTRGAFGRIIASNDGTPAGDLALIFNYMKLLDPGSVVREGEFATAQNATGVPMRVINLYNQLLSGERLNPAQRKNFTDQADKIFKQSQSNFETAIKPILNIGKSRGLTQDDILGEGFLDSLGVAKVEQPATTEAQTAGGMAADAAEEFLNSLGF